MSYDSFSSSNLRETCDNAVQEISSRISLKDNLTHELRRAQANVARLEELLNLLREHPEIKASIIASKFDDNDDDDDDDDDDDENDPID